MIEWTRVRLTNWGRWCRGRAVSGYPSASAFVFAGSGSRASKDISDAPSHIAEIDAAVAKIPAPLRQVLVMYYCTTAPLWFKAARLYISRRTLMRRLRTAEEKVHFYLLLADAPE
jgi:DNA-directed RNA polymerase specialized sigma24 family protein